MNQEICELKFLLSKKTVEKVNSSTSVNALCANPFSAFIFYLDSVNCPVRIHGKDGRVVLALGPCLPMAVHNKKQSKLEITLAKTNQLKVFTVI